MVGSHTVTGRLIKIRRWNGRAGRQYKRKVLDWEDKDHRGNLLLPGALRLRVAVLAAGHYSIRGVENRNSTFFHCTVSNNDFSSS